MKNHIYTSIYYYCLYRHSNGNGTTKVSPIKNGKHVKQSSIIDESITDELGSDNEVRDVKIKSSVMFKNGKFVHKPSDMSSANESESETDNFKPSNFNPSSLKAPKRMSVASNQSELLTMSSDEDSDTNSPTKKKRDNNKPSKKGKRVSFQTDLIPINDNDSNNSNKNKNNNRNNSSNNDRNSSTKKTNQDSSPKKMNKKSDTKNKNKRKKTDKGYDNDLLNVTKQNGDNNQKASSVPPPTHTYRTRDDNKMETAYEELKIEIKILLKSMESIQDKWNKGKSKLKTKQLYMLQSDILMLSQENRYFGDRINAMNDYICCVYKKWNLNDIIEWISYLENGRYKKYCEILKNGFKKDNITKGEMLPDINASDLSVKPFDIRNFSDRKGLEKHFKKLRDSNIK